MFVFSTAQWRNSLKKVEEVRSRENDPEFGAIEAKRESGEKREGRDPKTMRRQTRS